MITASQALSAIPAGLRDPLLREYETIITNYLERRWLPSELSGGRFSEIVYTILEGHAKNKYPVAPYKPANFVDACRKLESNRLPHVPHSFQILIPRMLPALYDVRNNRNVGHVGGDVDPNHMDAVVVLSNANWIMAELARVFHGLSVAEAQQVVDTLVEVRIPVVWSDGNVKRVLRPELRLHEQISLLVAVSVPDVTPKELLEWIEEDDKKYFMKTLRKLHRQRFVEFTETAGKVRILPPGTKFVQDLIRKKNLTGIT
jgi:hypothetical protein